MGGINPDQKMDRPPRFQLRLLANEVLRVRISSLPKGVASKMPSQTGVRETRKIIHMRGINERARLKDKDSSLVSKAVGKVVGEYSSADARANDDDIEIAGPDVL